MTLIVSLVVQEGIIMAADSLRSIVATVTRDADVYCKKHNPRYLVAKTKVEFPDLTVQTYPHVAKLFRLFGSLGVSAYGMVYVDEGLLFGQALREFEDIARGKGQKFKSVAETADHLADFIRMKLFNVLDHLKKSEYEFTHVGFHMCGYMSDTPEVVGRAIREDVRPLPCERSIDCDGNNKFANTIVDAMFADRDRAPDLSAMSLFQGAQLARYIIRATKGYQSYMKAMPVVGGRINIAAITKRNGFQWIRKPKGPQDDNAAE